jgi:two-component system chemotaxis response regulator CheY
MLVGSGSGSGSGSAWGLVVGISGLAQGVPMNELNGCDRPREPGPRVLVVDDHTTSRRYTVAALRQTGATVKASGAPLAALGIALRWLPDAICTDLQLPGMGGRDLIHRIRQGWPADRAQPLIVVVSADPLLPSHLPTLGADQSLLKPATPAQLRAVLGIRPADGVMEDRDGAAPAAAELLRLFRQELAVQLPVLEFSLARKELDRVRAILHQLLASSRLCGDRCLEADLQALHAACRGDAVAAEIARRYYTLLNDAGRYLGAARLCAT